MTNVQLSVPIGVLNAVVSELKKCGGPDNYTNKRAATPLVVRLKQHNKAILDSLGTICEEIRELRKKGGNN